MMIYSGFGCILKLPTACTLKTEETGVTYMNRGKVRKLMRYRGMNRGIRV